MSYTADSLDVVNATLQPLAQRNAQFPVLLYNHKNCTGRRYPEEGAFGVWNQDLDFEQVGFDTVVSLYVPPHVVLELWSPGNNDGYFAVQGPNLISDTGSFLAFWRHYDNSPCFATEAHCGQRVGSPHGWRWGVDFSRMRVTWNTSWVRLLHNLASNQQPLAFGGTTYAVDNDALFDELCPHPTNRYSCACHSAYQQLLQDHPQAASQSYVNILPNGCNPNSMFVPSQAQVGAVTAQNCTTQIHAQLTTGTFPTIANGGPEFYVCSGRVYVNAYSAAGTTTPDRTDATAPTVLLSPAATTTTNNTGLWYGVGALVLGVVLLLGVFWVLHHRPTPSARRRPPQPRASRNLHRIRMQTAFS